MLKIYVTIKGDNSTGSEFADYYSSWLFLFRDSKRPLHFTMK